MPTIINGSSPSITFSDSTTQSTAVSSVNPVFTGDASISGLTVGKGGGTNNIYNTALGLGVLIANTTGGGLTAIGRGALTLNTTGTDNTAVGSTYSANPPLYLNTTGSFNTALGAGTLASNTTASNNTAVGYQAGYSTTTAANNMYLGYQSGYSLTASSGGNTFIGVGSGYTFNTTSNGFNTLVGYQAGYGLTTGLSNTFVGSSTVGFGSGSAITTGSKNTIIGAYTGNQGGLDIRTASNYIVLSDGDGNPRQVIDTSGAVIIGATAKISSETLSVVTTGATSPAAIFKSASSTGDYTTVNWNTATSGNNQFLAFYTEASPTLRGSITYNRASGLAVYNTTSDYRAKDIIGPLLNSGEMIDSVPVYMGKMKEATQARPMFIAHETPDYSHTGKKDAVDKDGNPVYQQMDASSLVPVLWAEIQSLRKRVAQLESK